MSLESDIFVTRSGEVHVKTPGKVKRKYLGQERKRNSTFKPDSKNKINAVNLRIKKKRRKKKALQRKVV